MDLIVFEDNKYIDFLPLTYTKALFELKIGINTIVEKFIDAIRPEKSVFIARNYLAKVLGEKWNISVNYIHNIDEALIINGRLIPYRNSIENIIKLIRKHNQFLLVNNSSEVIAAKIKLELMNEFLDKIFDRPLELTNFLIKLKNKVNVIKNDDFKLINYIWDLIELNTVFLKIDFNNYVSSPNINGSVDDRAVIYGEENIFISSNVEIEGNVTIDGRKGPIFIDKDVEIYGPSRIEGPCYIGMNTRIVGGARIRSGSSIGPVCRVGGEVEETVFHGYVNMYHEGFIGHSYIGEWVNFGALTVNSDLKNTYGPVKVKNINTGKIKIGCFIADHVKTAIGTQIWTGKCIGVASHLYGVIYEDVPSFTIYAKSIGLGAYELKLESAIKTMNRVYSRRNRVPSESEIELIKKLFKLTENERRRLGIIKSTFKVP